MTEHEVVVRYLCAHECGHLAVGIILGGVSFLRLEINPELGSTSRVVWGRLVGSDSYRQALRLAGGMAAEKLLYRGWFDLEGSDAEKIEELGFSVEELVEEANRLLKERRGAFLGLYRFVRGTVLSGQYSLRYLDLVEAGVLSPLAN
ncbi:MAG: hypothetical protein ABH814_03200 [bacterium]